MAVSGMSLLWLQPMSTIVTGGREGALACESCVSFVTFLALSSSLKFVVLFTLLTIRGFGTSLFSCLHPPANTMSLSLYRMYAVCAECHRGSLQVLCTWLPQDRQRACCSPSWPRITMTLVTGTATQRERQRRRPENEGASEALAQVVGLD